MCVGVLFRVKYVLLSMVVVCRKSLLKSTVSSILILVVPPMSSLVLVLWRLATVKRVKLLSEGLNFNLLVSVNGV